VSCCDSCSDFSTLTVPTRTGWPLVVPLDDVVDDRVNLASSVLVDEVGLVGARIIGGSSGSARRPRL
jgi:hypothetical protein